MPLSRRAIDKLRDFNVPVSFKINDTSGKFIDARNVNTIQKRLDTRFGSSKLNAVSLGGAIQSLSSFSKSDGSIYTIAKVNLGESSDLAIVSESGAHTFLGLPLTVNTVHRAITENDRHIIAIGSDGLFSFNGDVSKFSRLGQAAPSTLTATIASGGSLIDTNIYRAAITFYSSELGFESNKIESLEVTAAGANKQITLTDIPSSALNSYIDKVYIYLKNVTTDSDFLFIEEISLGTTSYNIESESLSSQTPPTKNDVPGKNATDLYPGTGGGQFLTFFNSKLVYSGHSGARNEVYFSEQDLPDAFDSTDSALILVTPGKGAVTGLATGLFNDSVLDPFLVIFKGKSTHIYSEIGDQKKFTTISTEIGCVSHDTIQVKNGVVYFMSEEGWRAISNGRLVVDDKGDAITLGNGDIDDIFKSTGYVYEINRTQINKSFSVYYPTLDQYITWVAEGQNQSFWKAYVYEFSTRGFKPYQFAVPATCATLGENSNSRDIVLFGTSSGFIFKHSIMEERSDVDVSGTTVAINAFAVLPWVPQDGDSDATYNYREAILRAIVSTKLLTVTTYINYNLTNAESSDYDFNDPNTGFILDQSILDQDILGEDRAIKTARADINRVGESLAIGFYQNEIGANMGLVSLQIDLSKNGNRNYPSTSEEDEGGFDTETGDYFPSTSEAVQQCADYLQQIQTLLANFSASTGDARFLGYSARFNEDWDSDGVEDTFEKILLITYTPPTVSLSASGSGTVREKGDAVTSSTLTASVTKKSDLISRIKFYLNSVAISGADYNPPAQTGSGNTNHNWTGSFTDNATFKVEVTDDGTSGGPTTISSTTSFTFVYPYYYGSGVPGKTAAQVAALTKLIITSNASLNRVFTPSNGDVFYFAYPASYGSLTSILDENNFETISDWTVTTANITGLDGNAVSNKIYEFNNPVVAGTTNYTFKR